MAFENWENSLPLICCDCGARAHTPSQKIERRSRSRSFSTLKSAARARAQVVGALRSQLRSLKLVSVTFVKIIQENWHKTSLASTRELIFALHY